MDFLQEAIDRFREQAEIAMEVKDFSAFALDVDDSLLFD